MCKTQFMTNDKRQFSVGPSVVGWVSSAKQMYKWKPKELWK